MSEKTMNKMMEISDDAALLRAFPNAGNDIWNQNFVNDTYVIAYEFSWLHENVERMLPKVDLRFQTVELFILRYSVVFSCKLGDPSRKFISWQDMFVSIISYDSYGTV